MTNKLTSIEERLTSIETILSEIKEMLNPVEKSCIKMQNHISFVENTYDTIRGRLSYFVGEVPKINNV